MSGPRRFTIFGHSFHWPFTKRTFQDAQSRPFQCAWLIGFFWLKFPPFPTGCAVYEHIRYQERNIAEGKCSECPKPLDRNSVRYCTRHLDLARHRAARKSGVKGEPGSGDYLYGEITESTHGRQPGTLQSLALNREKKTRQVLAELGIPPESAATALEGAKAALLAAAPRSKKDALLAWELFDKAGVSDSLESTAKHALLELVSAGLVQRAGKGIKGDPYLYFAGGSNAKRELAEGHAIENAGRHLRG